ncbi:uncharacterized protein LOC116033190 [Ipomoea triloba]|uniref:uncharacterized protein LOC116033190 n=1 Tax=Ipomoea triloba TaxID=35885 RepID=UPI00125D64A0|nr:uncharacterized protein LOC116033190 [Ipomoea triloba]
MGMWQRLRSDWICEVCEVENLHGNATGADWCSLFSQAIVYNHEVVTFDHTTIYVELEEPKQSRQRRQFLFENAWLKDIGCKDVVMHAWNISVDGNFPTRLRQCAMALKHWGGNLAQRLNREIAIIQLQMQSLRERRDNSSLTEFRTLDSKLAELIDQQNIFWRQRAKQHWLQCGDRNTKFFHLYASARRRKNRITRLQDTNGGWVERDGLLNLVATYFQNVFSQKGVFLDNTWDSFAP